MNLYIVTTGLPGPDPATCGFVEVEDETGASVGPSTTGADWHEHPKSVGLYRLGPFAGDPFLSPTHAATIVRALAAANPTQTYEDDCALCSSGDPHEPDCPWRLAVEFVATEADPAQPPMFPVGTQIGDDGVDGWAEGRGPIGWGELPIVCSRQDCAVAAGFTPHGHFRSTPSGGWEPVA